MADTFSPERRSEIMASIRSKDTEPELAVRSLVHRMGLRYRVNTRPIKGVRRTADMVFRPAKVAVFIAGCFWHGCPEHYRQPSTNVDYWEGKLERNQRRDREVDALLDSEGWISLRIWEHEDPKTAADFVARTVEGLRNN